MTVEHRRDEANGQFPAGMRVLAVDGDPICLRLLETLLRKCQYHVTSTNQAITALKMLRENKNKFDLVISDVHMPGMDGFKLLEHVGLEMDLPVIMMSANVDTKLVMKGITHGACDYLVKPVRLEELKIIWQHVVRRKKLDSRDLSRCNSLDENSDEGNEMGGANSDQDIKLSGKRKDQNVNDDEEQDENEHENEEPSTQKKPHFVWSVELHRKFVAAVNQLGVDKAGPKKIMELMNVEELTRENVASHLQIYRLYLRRISCAANQQANMVAAFGGPGSPYLRMNALNFHSVNSSPQFQNNYLGPIPPAGVLGRLNSPSGMGLHGLSPSGLVHLGQAQIPTSSIPNCSEFQTHVLPGDHTGTVLEGMPTSLEFYHLQHRRNDNSRNFPVSSNSVISGSSSSALSIPNSSLTMQGRSQVTSDSVSSMMDHGRCNSHWPAPVQAQLAPVNPVEIVVHGIPHSRLDTQSEVSLTSDHSVQQNTHYVPKQAWDTGSLDGSVNSLMTAQGGYDPFGSIGTIQARFDSLATEQNQLLKNNSGLNMAMKLKQEPLVDQGGKPLSSNYAGTIQARFDSLATKQNQLLKNYSGLDMAMKLKQGPLVDQGGKPLGSNYAGTIQARFDSLATEQNQLLKNNSGLDMAKKLKQGPLVDQGGKPLGSNYTGIHFGKLGVHPLIQSNILYGFRHSKDWIYIVESYTRKASVCLVVLFVLLLVVFIRHYFSHDKIF